MPNRNRELGTATLGGLVACGMVTIALDLAEVSFSTIIGAVVGGLVAAYLLYGKMSQATIAGALSGVLAIPFLFGVSEILLIFEVIPIPSVPNPPLSQIQEQVAAIVVTNLIAGAIGGAILSAVHHPPKGLPPPPPPPGSAAGPVRYCVQCGAQLPSGAMICPHCNARQPQ
jgi:hypothetical protein